MAASAEAARILVVDDDAGLLHLMAEALRAEGYRVAKAATSTEAAAALASELHDLMLLDLKLGDLSGSELIAKFRNLPKPVPFVVVTGQGDEKVAVEVMKQGALDYVMKDAGLLDLLPGVARRALDVVEQKRKLTEARAESERLEREIFETGERERRRIGEDLHDGLGQQLTAIELMCAGLVADMEGQPALVRRLRAMGILLREAISQTRSLARGLVPIGDDPEALRLGLAELAERARSLGKLDCRLECASPVFVDDRSKAVHLYRIAQEAVNNAVKHSRARKVTIRLARRPGEIELAVADDGKGLAKNRGSGMGLGVMSHRADAIGAKLSVESGPGGGVTVTCRLPVTP